MSENCNHDCASCDAGEIESIQVPELAQLADYIERGAY